MSFQLRDLNEGDLPELMALVNEVSLVPISLSNLTELYKHQPEGQIRRARVATDGSGLVCGSSRLNHDPWEEGGLFDFWIAVKPEQQGQGLGSRLFDDAFTAVSTFNVKKLKAFMRDDQPEWLRFAQNRGFTIQNHLFGSTIDLAEFDERPFAALIDSVEASNIRLTSLADMGDTEDARRTLHAALTVVSQDTPGSPSSDFPSFEAFSEMLNTARWSRSADQIMAVEGNKCVGFAVVSYNTETNTFLNLFTGVLPTYRRRKIAQALKLKSIGYAKDCGADFIYTNNDSHNAPMLAINRKLGYKPQPGNYLLHKQL